MDDPVLSPPTASSIRHNSSTTPPADHSARKTKRTVDHLGFLVPKIRRVTPKGFKNVYAKTEKADSESKSKKTTYVPGDGFDIFEALPVGMPLGGKKKDKSALRVRGLGRLDLTLGSLEPEKNTADSKQTKTGDKTSIRGRKRRAEDDVFDFSNNVLPDRAGDSSKQSKRGRNRELDAFDAAIGHLAPRVKKTKTPKRVNTPILGDGNELIMNNRPLPMLDQSPTARLGQMKRASGTVAIRERAPHDTSFHLRPTLQRRADLPSSISTQDFAPGSNLLCGPPEEIALVDVGTTSSPLLLDLGQSFPVRMETEDHPRKGTPLMLGENGDMSRPVLTATDIAPGLSSPQELQKADTTVEVGTTSSPRVLEVCQTFMVHRETPNASESQPLSSSPSQDTSPARATQDCQDARDGAGLDVRMAAPRNTEESGEAGKEVVGHEEQECQVQRTVSSPDQGEPQAPNRTAVAEFGTSSTTKDHKPKVEFSSSPEGVWSTYEVSQTQVVLETQLGNMV